MAQNSISKLKYLKKKKCTSFWLYCLVGAFGVAGEYSTGEVCIGALVKGSPISKAAPFDVPRIKDVSMKVQVTTLGTSSKQPTRG